MPDCYPPNNTTNITVLPGTLQSFTSDDLVANKITLTHTLDAYGACVTVIDGDGYVVIPDEIKFFNDNGTNKLEIDLTSYAVTGTWYVKLT